MRTSLALAVHSTVTFALLSLTTQALAADDSYVSAMRYVSLDVSGDDADARQYSVTGSTAFGKYTWLQGTLGKITDSSNSSTNRLGDLSTYGIGAGYKAEHLQLGLNFNHYKNDANYRQRDINATLDWFATGWSIGADVFHRNTDNSADTTVTRTFPIIGLTTIPVHADASIAGNGFGLHASVNLTDNLTLSLGGMSYSYSNDLTITSGTNASALNQVRDIVHPIIRDYIQQRLQYLADSRVTNALALLDNSYHLGLSYQLDSVLLATAYQRDKALDSDNVTNTVSLGASLFAGDHWIVAPTIGQSDSDQSGKVNFGSVSVSYNW